MPKVCTCGRSQTGQCVGLHSLSVQEWNEKYVLPSWEKHNKKNQKFGEEE